MLLLELKKQYFERVEKWAMFVRIRDKLLRVSCRSTAWALCPQICYQQIF